VDVVAEPVAAPSERLRRAVEAHAAALRRVGIGTDAPAETPPLRRPSRQASLDAVLGGEWHETEHGRVFVRDEWFAPDHQHGNAQLCAALDVTPDILAELALTGAVDGRASDRGAGGLAFFDIETTGLGGTGTYVVLAGLGTFETVVEGQPPSFRMRQYFLADLGGEPAMLAMLVEDLARFDGVVTYNGRAFDVPVVEARLTMSRLRSPYGRMSHIDLLHAVRRLYRHRMATCRLPDAERRLLRIEREDDLPGRLIPSIYFDYVRAGATAQLPMVFRHNADDVISLVGVLSGLAALLSADGGHTPDDAVAVARWWERCGRADRALALYRSALGWLSGTDDWSWAAARHAGLCKRSGERDEAAALWRRLWAQGDRDAGLELAKHLEHHARDLAAAEEVASALMVRAGAAERIALEHRIARLRRKRRILRREPYGHKRPCLKSSSLQ
jgi:uncharacterized protein YprB with RNaseH-like and TPR domain